MRGTAMVAFLLASSFGLPGYAVPQDQPPKPNIEQQLRNQYQLTRVGANGVVVQAGSVLVVQQDNIKANPASNLLYWSNLYKKDGHVKQPAIMIKSGSSGVDKSSIRFLQVGEKVYVTNIEFKPAAVVFSLQSCGACNPSATDPNDVPYRAELSFQFQKGFLDAGNFEDIKGTIGQVFAIAPPIEGSTAAAAPASSTSESNGEAHFQPIQPPPPPADQPPPPPKTISKGDTKDYVVAAFGQPERMVKLGAKEIYYYKDLKVTFVNGKVTDVQ
jgi:hypothetical protein